MITQNAKPKKEARKALAKVDFYFDDWLSGTSDLTPEQRGVYITLCALYWSKDGHVRDEDQWMARQCNMSTRRFRRVKQDLISSGKIRLQDGFIANERAEIERINARRTKDFYTEIGRKGGEKTAEKRTKKAENSGQGPSGATSGATTSLPNPSLHSPSPPESTSAREATDDDVAVQVIQIFDDERAKAFGENQRRPYPHNTDKVFAERWLDAGATLETCRDVFGPAMGKMAAAGKSPPGTLNYFDNPIREAIGVRVNGGNGSRPANGYGSGTDTDFDPEEARRKVQEQFGGERP